MDIRKISGVGPKTAKCLNSLNIKTVKDAILYYPRDYEERGNIKNINDLIDGETASVIAEVSLIYPGRRSFSGKYVNRILFKNETGYIVGVWFSKPYITNNFDIGKSVFLFGKISKKTGEIQIIEPQYEKINSNNKTFGIYPVYSLNKSVGQKLLRKVISESLKYIDSEIEDILPDSLKNLYNLPDIKTSILNIHFPKNREMLESARRRIKFEELLTLQLVLFIAKKNFIKEENAYCVPVCKEMLDFKNSLPFTLTGAQSHAIREILSDMKRNNPMNRLLQGDVGSGKTIIAATALFNCAMNGFEGALMAPTEILAVQHFESITKLVSRWNIKTALITGSTPKKEKEAILEELANGSIGIVIGTHALIQENVEFKNLALVITDEQHRFGVRQRAELVNKGKNPHVLVMTATPIPRTLALFLYGDMDITVLNEIPPGRQKINTYSVGPDKKDRIYKFILSEVLKGNQAYIVCPLVEESDKIEAESAVEIEKKLKEKYFKNINVGLVHGRMASIEKDNVMKEFKEGKIMVLVSTTVIEVGVNVPNATIMVVENADRFGLAQLHQLRGRVGRGTQKSYCILISDLKNLESKKRMDIMVKTNDGFVISEKDMEMRGTGEFFGLRQHGLPELMMADIFKDIDILKETHEVTEEIIENNKINTGEYAKIKKQIENLKEKIDSATFN